MKVNKTYRNGKKVWEWIAIGLKLLTNFFTKLSSRFAAGRSSGSLAQEMDEAREAEGARKREYERQDGIREDERKRRDEDERRRRDEDEHKRRDEDERRRGDEDERKRRDEDERRRRDEDERKRRDKHMRLAREMQQTLNQDVARLNREHELRKKQRELGHDGPSIEI